MNTSPKRSNYGVDLFSYDKDEKTFITEASTLGFKPGKFPKYIMIKGTKKRVLYKLQEVNAMKAIYVPTENSLKWTAECAGTKLSVLQI